MSYLEAPTKTLRNWLATAHSSKSPHDPKAIRDELRRRGDQITEPRKPIKNPAKGK